MQTPKPPLPPRRTTALRTRLQHGASLSTLEQVLTIELLRQRAEHADAACRFLTKAGRQSADGLITLTTAARGHAPDGALVLQDKLLTERSGEVPQMTRLPWWIACQVIPPVPIST